MSKNNETGIIVKDFTHYFIEHQAFYEFVIDKSNELYAEAAAFKALAVRWAEAKITCAEKDDAKAIKCKTGCNLALVYGDGAPFGEDDEIAELTRLKGALKTLYVSFAGMRPWLSDVKEQSQKGFPSATNDLYLNKLCLEQLVIVNNEERVLYDLYFAAKILKKASGLFAGMDFSLRAIQDDFLGPRFISKLLLVISTMVDDCAVTAREWIDLLNSNQQYWQKYNEILRNQPIVGVVN